MTMTSLSLCIEPILTAYNFYDRIKIAAEAGYNAIEFWDPANKDIDKIARLTADNNIAVAICCAKNAWQTRISSPIDKVIENIKDSMEIAKTLGSKSVIVFSGDDDPASESEKGKLIENLKRVADIAVQNDITICMEALSSRGDHKGYVDHKGYFLESSKTGFEIINAVGCDHIKLLYDVYHMQIMEGNIISNITKNIDKIGHFQSAGVPRRDEIFNGEIEYRNLIKAINEAEYDRYFGLEYWTTYDDYKSLADCIAYLK